MKTNELRKYLAADAMDAGIRDLNTALDESLADHDRKYHPNGFKDGDTCNKRKEMAKRDEVDSSMKDDGSDETNRESGAISDAEFREANPTPNWVVRNHISEDSVKREFAKVKVPVNMKSEGYKPVAGALSLDERLFVYLTSDMDGNWHYMDVDGSVENHAYGKLPNDSFIVRL